MSYKGRMLFMAAIWLSLAGYAWHLFSRSGARIHFALIVVGIGMAAANAVRAAMRKEKQA